MEQTLLLLAVIVAAYFIYRPILKKAQADIAARSAAGLSNAGLYALLLFPLIGPFIYIVLRKHFAVE